MGRLKPNYGMDFKWVQSIFVVSLYEIDQITKIKIERDRVTLHFPMLGIKKRIWSRGWSHDHTRRPIMSQNTSFYSVFGSTC